MPGTFESDMGGTFKVLQSLIVGTPESAVVLLRASPQQYDQPHERKVDEIKENFTFAEHYNLDAEITALLMPKAL